MSDNEELDSAPGALLAADETETDTIESQADTADQVDTADADTAETDTVVESDAPDTDAVEADTEPVE